MRFSVLMACAAAIMVSAGCASDGAPQAARHEPALAAASAPPPLLQPSAFAFDETLARLRSEVESAGFKIIAVVDHAGAAKGAGLDLAPSTLLIFGNPAGGTPLMQADASLGLDLPLRALVYQTADGRTFIARHDLIAIGESRTALSADIATRFAKIAAALERIVKSAAGA